MYRLANFDITKSIESEIGRLAVQLLFGLACAVAMVLLRLAIDVIAPTAGPFALVYPTVLLATLYGCWQGGVIAFVGTFAWAWYMVLPPSYSFEFAVDTDPSRVILNAVAVLVVIVFAETFRRAVRQAAAQRDEEIERRRMLLTEIEHRTKNNFALVLSMLELQKRRDESGEVKAALDQAISRVTSFARAYANLSDQQGEGASVAMRPYMSELIDHIRSAGFADNVTVVLDSHDFTLPREVAVAIGLFTNEALTNTAKHAFPDERPGSVAVALNPMPNGWRLDIADDGVGWEGAGVATGKSGMGTRLFEAFAQQAGARFESDETDSGRRVSLIAP